MRLSSYRIMWVLVMFDLPVKTSHDRRRYVQFRRKLLQDGFVRMQFSVYTRYCPSRENAEVHAQRVERFVPENGDVRSITITDKQYARMRTYWGKRRRAPDPGPEQLLLF